MDSTSLNNFGREPCKDHSCKVSLKLAKWFQRRSRLKKMLTDDNGPLGILIALADAAIKL